MKTSREITIVYQKGLYGRFRTLQLYADDEKIGSVKQGQTVTVRLPDGAQTFYGMMDWAKTTPFMLAFVEDGDVLTITPWFTLNLFRNIGAQPMPIRIECKNKSEIGVAV